MAGNLSNDVGHLHRWIWVLENALVAALDEAGLNPDLADALIHEAAIGLGMPDLVRPGTNGSEG